MTKLESLKEFQEKKMNSFEMSKTMGGNAPATETGSGTACVPTTLSASGCMAYSSDYITDRGGINYVPTNSTAASSDVNNPC